jgi:hypothetical protein
VTKKVIRVFVRFRAASTTTTTTTAAVVQFVEPYGKHSKLGKKKHVNFVPLSTNYNLPSFLISDI